VAGIILFILSLLFVSAVFLSSQYNSRPVRLLHAVAVTWLGSTYFWGAASFITWIMYDFASYFSIHMNPLLLAEFIFGIAALAAIGSLINGWIIQKTIVRVELKNLPQAWKGRTAVWASDLHLGHIRGIRFATAAVKAINKAKPDIVFIGGDLFDGVKDDYKKVSAPLKGIIAPLGSYFVFGNHEEFSKSSHYNEAVLAAGLKMLKDEKVEIDGMQIIGVDYHTANKREDFQKNLALLAHREKPSILLKHVPDNLNIAENAGISLQISGHTHKAQMWPFNYFARKMFHGYEYGLKRHGSMLQLTSSGAGTWGPPFRLGTRGEIVVITFI